MFTLRNKLDRKTAEQKVQQEAIPRKTVSFYRYVRISDPLALRNELFRTWSALGVLGRIYLAEEGINAQFSVPTIYWDVFVRYLYSYKQFDNMPFKIAVEEPNHSFVKLCIKIKKQIVADGLQPSDYDVTNVGKHLTPEEFHDALQAPNTIVVDMRNQYESKIGKFEGAITPDADTFKEELPMVKEMLQGNEDKKILLYCTGGVRCEKASAYLKHQGFHDVNQLHGGIIHYAHRMKELGIESKFKGKNYVFDDRGAETITEDILSTCDQCDSVCDTFTNCHNVACNLLFIQCSSCKAHMNNCCSDHCKSVTALSPEAYKAYRKRVGPTNHTLFISRQRPKEHMARQNTLGIITE